MGMTIDEAMNHIKYGIIEENYPLPRDLGIEACNFAIDTMRKYQKIEQILQEPCIIPEGCYSMLKKIIEVVKDGKID